MPESEKINYDYVVLQATDNSVPFYESMGFTRVGAITLDESEASGENKEKEEKEKEVPIASSLSPSPSPSPSNTPPPPPPPQPLPPLKSEIVTSATIKYETTKFDERPLDMAKQFNCDVWDIIFLNRPLYPGLIPSSRLQIGTELFVPDVKTQMKNCDAFTTTKQAFYTASDNETPKMIGEKLQIDWRELVRNNKARHPGLLFYSKLQEGTLLKLSGDEYIPYCHWSFPEDNLESASPSYMMARRLNRVKRTDSNTSAKIRATLDALTSTTIVAGKQSKPTYTSTDAYYSNGGGGGGGDSPTMFASSGVDDINILPESKKRPLSKAPPSYAPKPPKKPSTSFIIYSSEHRDILKAENSEWKFLEISKELGRRWTSELR